MTLLLKKEFLQRVIDVSGVSATILNFGKITLNKKFLSCFAVDTLVTLLLTEEKFSGVGGTSHKIIDEVA